MINKLLGMIPIWGYVVIALTAGWSIHAATLNHKIDNLQQEATELAFDVENERAAHAETKEITVEINRLLSNQADSTRYFSKLAVQRQIERDSIDEALKATTEVTADLETRVNNLQDTVSVLAEEQSDSVRKVTTSEYKQPFSLDLTVLARSPPLQSTVNYNIGLDVARMGVRVQCSPSEASDRINSASVLVSTPRWLEANITNIQTSPQVCNPQTIQPDMPFYKDWKFGAGGVGLLWLASKFW